MLIICKSDLLNSIICCHRFRFLDYYLSYLLKIGIIKTGQAHESMFCCQNSCEYYFVVYDKNEFANIIILTFVFRVYFYAISYHSVAKMDGHCSNDSINDLLQLKIGVDKLQD